MLSTLTALRNRLSYMPRRNIVTYAKAALKADAESLRKQNPHFQEDLTALENSPNTFHVTSGSKNQYNFKTQTLETHPGSTEGLIHETHHAAQHDHLLQHSPDNVDTIIRSPAHRMAMEASALASGKSASGLSAQQLRKDTFAHWRGYQGQPGYASIPVGIKVLRNKVHSYSQQRLKKFGLVFPGWPQK
jgi:hypothetical protein